MGKGQRKTHEQFVAEVKELHGSEYAVISQYVKSSQKVTVRHDCGHEYEIYPGNLLTGYKCPKCAGQVMTPEDFRKIFESKYDLNEYELIGEYVNAKTRVAIRHLKCGSIRKLFPVAIKRGDGCGKCSKTNAYTPDEFKKLVYEKLGDEYTLLEDYKGALKRIRVRHNKCGKEYLAIASSLLRGNKCRKCTSLENAAKRAWTHEYFAEKVRELAGDDYVVLGQYKNTRTKIRMKHIQCGSEFEMRPGDFVHGTRCPECNLSKGGQAVKDYLVKSDVKFKTEFKLKGCKHKQLLPFDFAVFHDNGELKALVEYQGIQHYKPTNYFNGEEKLERQQRNDAIKRAFCQKNKLNLIEIPYWDFDNIEKILKIALSA